MLVIQRRNGNEICYGYILNLLMVEADLVLYYRNKRLDMRGGTSEDN